MNNKNNNQELQDAKSIHSVYQPSQALIDNWKLWMAHEVVEQWQNSSRPDFEPWEKEVCNIADEQIISMSLNSLKQKIQDLKANITTVRDLERAEEAIRKYLVEENIGNVQKQVNCLKGRHIDKIRQLISVYFREVCPKELTKLLEHICLCLNVQKNDLEAKRLESTKISSSAWSAYLKLFQELQELPPNSIKFKRVEESIWNGISIYFESQLKAEIFSLYLRNVGSLFQFCHNYYDSVKSSDDVLEQIKRSLKEKSRLEIVSLPVFTYLKKIDAESQKRSLEHWSCKGINHWGRSAVSWQQIEAKLVKNIEPSVIEVCKEFQHCFIRHACATNNTFFLSKSDAHAN